MFLPLILPGQAPLTDSLRGASDSAQFVRDSIRFVKENTFYTLPSDPYHVHGIDTSLQNVESFYDIQDPRWEYLDHGYYGSPHQPIQYISSLKPGFRIGQEAYDRYRYGLEDIRDYYVNRPYTEVRFLVGQDREQLFEGIHTQNIGKQFNFGLHFKRRATKGRYQRHESLISSLDFYSRYLSNNGRFAVRTDLTFNRIKQQESGGFAVDLYGTDTSFALPNLIPVNLDLAGNDWRDVSFQIGAEVYFGPKESYVRDSVKRYQVRKTMAAFFDAGVKDNKHLFIDPNDRQGEIAFYGDFYQDEDTIRYLFDSRNFYYQGGFRFYTNPFTRNILLQQRTAVIEVLARHENLEISQYGFEKTYNNFSLHASISDSRRPESKGLQYFAEGGLYLSGYNQADFYVSGNLAYQSGKWGRFGAWGEWSKREPSWQQRYYISPSLNWKNDFNKEGKLEFGFDYQWMAQDLEIGFQWTQLTDYIYFDTASLPQQRSGSLNLATFWVGKQFHFGIFHMDHFVSLQFSQDKEVMPVPALQLKSSFFIEAFVFKKAMLARLGLDLRYFTGFSVYRFNPLINQHYLSSREEVFAPTIDVFLNFRVKTVRFVVRMQNITQGFFNKGNYGVYPYSLYNRTFTAGFYWRFLD